MSPLAHLTGHRASTAVDSDDTALRGRTYAIPFDRVWRAVTGLASGGFANLRLVSADDRSGVVIAEASTRFPRHESDILIDVGLDANAQTRVDMVSASRTNGMDLGANRRRIVRFFEALDAALEVMPGQVLEGAPRATR